MASGVAPPGLFHKRIRALCRRTASNNSARSRSAIRPNAGRDKAFRSLTGGHASARYAAGEWKNMQHNLAEGLNGLIVCGLCRRDNAAVPTATNCRK